MVLRKLQIDVDLNKVVRYNPEVWGRVGDKDLVVLSVSTFDTSDDIKKVVDLTGATMYFTFARPDGTYFRDSLSISNTDLKNGKFDYTLPANVFAQAGVFNCHFRIEQGGTTKNRTSTRDFKLVIEADPLQGNIAMPNFASDIDQLNADIQAEIADSRAELDDALAELATASSGVDAAVLRANEVIASIEVNQVVPISSTTNWQKGVKITADNGYSKAVPVGVADWNAFTETGFYSIYATSLMANKPPAVGLYLDVEIHRRSGDTTFQRVTDITNNRTYYRSQMAGVWTAWAEGETVAGAQEKANTVKTYIDNKLVDTGWTPLVLKSGFSAGTSIPRYRKVGNEVRFRGLLVRSGNTTKGVFATMPEGFRTGDSYLEGFPGGQQTGVAGTTTLLYAKTNGDLELVSAVADSSVWLSTLRYDID
ncbi:BppU family phage baseplate upper protein [Listeria booriae]|uniref:BppU family phage baseplate upper protein n=1 Tax=Listeria booriae TaxID=1552123 RepID=UPI001623CD4D|nr:BppU family phage baseplate upper protein [Listeria booriae]MBC1524437.1 BppU family phage baseplate upper protein [Listeria booriae]